MLQFSDISSIIFCLWDTTFVWLKLVLILDGIITSLPKHSNNSPFVIR